MLIDSSDFSSFASFDFSSFGLGHFDSFGFGSFDFSSFGITRFSSLRVDDPFGTVAGWPAMEAGAAALTIAGVAAEIVWCCAENGGGENGDWCGWRIW